MNSYWNEAMNPSWFIPGPREKIRAKLPEYCPLYRAHPEFYVPANAEELDRKYAKLPLRPNPENRLESVCLR